MKALGVDIFAGGFSAGVEKHFEVWGHLEHAPYGESTVKLNRPGWMYQAGGPRSWADVTGPVDFIYCNPPCAPYSQAAAGRAMAWHEDPRLQCARDCVGLLYEIHPQVLAIESVVEAWTKGRDFWLTMAKRAGNDLGYSTTVLLHDASRLGVPQRRKRVFFVFHKVDLGGTFEDENPTPEVSVAQAFKGLRIQTKRAWDVRLPERLEKLWHASKPGEKLFQAYDRLYPDPPRNARGQAEGRPGFLVRRLPWEEPAGVLLGGSLIHPKEPRYLYREELNALATFPSDWAWPSGMGFAEASTLASRGVAPKVGEWLARNVRKALERGRRLNRTSIGVMDLRTGVQYDELEEEG